MTTVVSREALEKAVADINGWHPTVPLVLAFSMQGRKPKETLSGSTEAVRAALLRLFPLELAGLEDDAQTQYLHLCHGQKGEYPYARRRPITDSGKAHQRTIKDTFANPDGFLERTGPAEYRLRPLAVDKAKQCLRLDAKLDLRPLVLLVYWRFLGEASQIADLWHRFCQDFHVDKPPYSQLFECSGLDAAIPTMDAKDFTVAEMRRLLLPDEYGTGTFGESFWRRFCQVLARRLHELDWVGPTEQLVLDISSGLMFDQAVFLLGAPGTGKTTLVREAILPALREAHGTKEAFRFWPTVVTPETSIADLLGFQGLDGSWVPGPLVGAVLVPAPTDQNGDASDVAMAGELAVPRLLFFDEANRTDIEALLSPLQSAFDRLQSRQEPDPVVLGNTAYIVPHRVWRIFAGNSPAADVGRRVQSRPFKRRIPIALPPDPISEMLRSSDRFCRFALQLLSRTMTSEKAELRQSATTLHGQYVANPGRLEALHELLLAVSGLRTVAVTVGLVESLLMRAACETSVGADNALDVALRASLLGLLTGERRELDTVLAAAERHGFANFAASIREQLLDLQPAMSLEINPLL